jgi:hypothetical protein
MQDIKFSSEAASADHSAADLFHAVLLSIINTDGHLSKKVFNPNKLGHFRKQMPASAFISLCAAALTSLKPTGYGMHQQVEHFNNCMLCPHCIYVFCIFLRTDSDLCHLMQKPEQIYQSFCMPVSMRSDIWHL